MCVSPTKSVPGQVAIQYIKASFLGPTCTVCLSNNIGSLASEVSYLGICYNLGLSVFQKHSSITMIQIKSKVFKIHNKDQEEHGLDLNRETVHSELQIDQEKKVHNELQTKGGYSHK